MGQWKDVVVDDWIPCNADSRRQLFAQSSDPNELWVCLLEKAFARFYGSYMALVSGLGAEYIQAMVGGSPIYETIEDYSQDNIWKMMSEEESVKKYLCAGSAKSEPCHWSPLRHYQVLRCGWIQTDQNEESVGKYGMGRSVV